MNQVYINYYHFFRNQKQKNLIYFYEISFKKMTTEEKLRKIIDENKPKSITLDGKKVYITKNKIQEIRDLEKSQHEGGILTLAALLPLI